MDGRSLSPHHTTTLQASSHHHACCGRRTFAFTTVQLSLPEPHAIYSDFTWPHFGGNTFTLCLLPFSPFYHCPHTTLSLYHGAWDICWSSIIVPLHHSHGRDSLLARAGVIPFIRGASLSHGTPLQVALHSFMHSTLQHLCRLRWRDPATLSWAFATLSTWWRFSVRVCIYPMPTERWCPHI